MTPWALLLVPTVASAIGLPLSNAPHFLDLGSSAQQLATEVAAAMSAINSAVVDVVRVAYLTFLLVGFLLYFSHIARRMGKDLIVGGVMLVVLTEYVIPALAGLVK